MNKDIIPLNKSIQRLEKQDFRLQRLRFPNYRNLAKNTVLAFTFPITILLGRNGTNKSSILHALYGCAEGNTIGTFWFETDLDAIPSTRDGLKQSVAYTYMDGETSKEYIKARAPRKDDPDYWETVKPTRPYGFVANAKREPPISIPILHLDFRGELPAFDKYFYFPNSKHLNKLAQNAKERGHLRRAYREQDYLRQRSRLLKRQLETDGTSLTCTELRTISYILEREYTSGKILQHSLFHGHSGSTIIFSTPTNDFDDYSEAFAGSGESAAALLVHRILAAKESSLVLLDEPETSLHPRAQQRLLQFLAHQACTKNLQIIIATHSRYFAEGLSQQAIRVLRRDDFGRIEIRDDLTVQEALHEVGDLPAGKTILVEDESAKLITLECLKLQSPVADKEIHVRVRDGGVARLYADIQAHSNSGHRDIFILFDGDQEPKDPLPAASELPQGKRQLRALISDLTSGNNSTGQKFNFVDTDEMTRYINFFRSNVKYLPTLTPEQLVWNDEVARQLASLTKLSSKITATTNYKERLNLLAKLVPGMDRNGVFQYLLSRFLAGSSEEKERLVVTICEIRNSASHS
jgi:predicted ATPase